MLAVLSAGDRLAGRQLLELLSRKGFTEIWLARAPEGDQVAIQAAPVRGRSEGKLRERLNADFRLTRTNRHPNVARVLDVGIEAGWHYVVTEHIDGFALSTLLELSQKLELKADPWVAARITRELAKALAFVHTLTGPDGEPIGALHRGFAPASVVISRSGQVFLTELLAARDSQDLVETAGHEQLGITAYVSPELVEHGHRDAKSDLFALGAILWELLAGRPLFQRATDLETLEAIRKAEIPRIQDDIPRALEIVAQRCLARRPDQRFPDAGSLLMALDVILANAPDGDEHGGIAGWVAEIERKQPSNRPRTFVFSAASQSSENGDPTDPGPPPRQMAVSGQAHRTLPSNPPTADPFFDADRDSGGIDNPRFEILGRLGSGGMGEVYRVRDKELNEVLALKLVPRHASPEMLERLKREVRLARRISSDHVCRIFDLVDLGHGLRGLTMALIEGTTLAELMKVGLRVDYQRFARWGADIAEGLGAAHALSIIHRDLKPENVMITASDEAVVLDFGIARSQAEAADIDQKLTRAGIIMGTPLYMAPEQLTNRSLDGRSDLYALGLILAESITGQVPIHGENYAEILDRRVIKGELYSLRDIDPGAPAELATLIDQLVRPAADDRPSHAALVSEALRAFAENRSIRPVELVAPSPLSTPPGAMTPRPLLTPLPSLVPVAATPTPLPAPEPANTRIWWGAIAILSVAAVILVFYAMRSRVQLDPIEHAVFLDGGTVSSTSGVSLPVAPLGPTDAGANDASTQDRGDRSEPPQKKWTPPPPEEM